MNRSKAKGSRYERLACRELMDSGYLVTRSGGSLGMFDLIAVSPVRVLLVQVKAGTPRARCPRPERLHIAACAVPPSTQKEIWLYDVQGRGKPTTKRVEVV